MHPILVRPAGLEPATPCLEGRCSIHLSYGRIRTYADCFLYVVNTVVEFSATVFAIFSTASALW
jgi:hypothetical protein